MLCGLSGSDAKATSNLRGPSRLRRVEKIRAKWVWSYGRAGGGGLLRSWHIDQPVSGVQQVFATCCNSIVLGMCDLKVGWYMDARQANCSLRELGSNGRRSSGAM